MRPTTTVLATIKNEDFLYTCEGHLEDVNFASRMKEGGRGQVEQVQVKQGQVKQRRVEQEQEQVNEVKQEQEQVKQEQEQVKQEQEQVNEVKQEQEQVKQKQVKKQYSLHRDFFSSTSSLSPLSC